MKNVRFRDVTMKYVKNRAERYEQTLDVFFALKTEQIQQVSTRKSTYVADVNVILDDRLRW